MLHSCGSGGRSRIVQRCSWVVVVVLQLVLIGGGLLACGLLLLAGGRLDLGWRLDSGGRNLWLVVAGLGRIERDRQHLLETHARNAPRDVPRTWVVLHGSIFSFFSSWITRKHKRIFFTFATTTSRWQHWLNKKPKQTNAQQRKTSTTPVA